MAVQASLAVESLGIAHVERLENGLEPCFGPGNRHQMDVITHQAVGEDRHIVLIAVVLEPRQIGFPIVIGKEDVFTPIAALGDVVRYAGKDGSGETGHTHRIAFL